MREITINPLFEVGAEVIEHGSNRRGTISKIWVKPIRVEETKFTFEVAYSVVREGTYNNFRSKEDRLREIVTDLEGNSVIMPKGMSSKD